MWYLCFKVVCTKIFTLLSLSFVVLRGPEPVQRLQVPVRRQLAGRLPHAVVRPAQQVHAPQGESVVRRAR